MSKFDGKTALITGAGSGIGRATALKFAAEGASVVIGNRNAKAGQETVDLIQQAGGKASFYQTDVTKLSNVRELVKYTVDTYGGLHAAFNNAGVEDPEALTPDQTDEASFILGQEIAIDGGFTAI